MNSNNLNFSASNSYSSSSSSSSSWQAKLIEAQDTATKATKLEFAKNYNAAFAHYVRSGQLFLWLLNNFPSPSTSSSISNHHNGLPNSAANSFGSQDAPYSREKLKNMATKVMQRAEKIKSLKTHLVEPVLLDPLSDEQQSNVVRISSTINGVRCPAWSEPPPNVASLRAETSSGSSKSEHQLWTDPDGLLKLSRQQIRKGAVWRRPLRSHTPNQEDPTKPPKTNTAQAQVDFGSWPSSQQLKGKDIVQDIVSDCSFVAALEVACEHDARWGTNLATKALYPKDPRTSLPTQSPDGRYTVKFHINGIERAVSIDDHLPYYPDPQDADTENASSVVGGKSDHPRLMCASVRDNVNHVDDKSGPLIWPALVEKAYLKLMGGYDFHGSDSSLDLYALTGWIPEQVFLHKSGFQREKAWKRIYEAYYPPSSSSSLASPSASSNRARASQLMITAGTGASESVVGVGLVQKHNYAVLDLKESGSNRYVRLMNPWRNSASGSIVAITVPSHHAKQIFGSSGTQTEEQVVASRDAALHDLLARQVDLNTKQDEQDPTFTVTWDDLCTYFDSIYLNWDPQLFAYSVRAHSSWTVATQHPATPPQLDTTIVRSGTSDVSSTTRGSTGTANVANPSSARCSTPTSFSSIDATQNPQFRLTLAGANLDSVRATTASHVDAGVEDQTEEEDQVWLLLTRHYPGSTQSGTMEKDQATATTHSSGTAQAHNQSTTTAFIAIHVFEPTYTRSHSSSGSSSETGGGRGSVRTAPGPSPTSTSATTSIAHSTRKTGYYVDGRQTLVRLFPSRGLRRTSLADEVTYTIVPSLQLEGGDSVGGTKHNVYNYTLTIYTRLRPILALCAVVNQFPFKQTFSGSWTQKSAGGNATFPTFIHNPQYKLTLFGKAKVKLTLQTKKSVPVQVVLTYPPHLPSTTNTMNGSASTTRGNTVSGGDSGDLRVSTLQEGDIILSSGMYNHGFATTSTLYHPTNAAHSSSSSLTSGNGNSEAELEAGTYVVICSTFEPNTLVDYSLIVESKPIGIAKSDGGGGGGGEQGLLTVKLVPQEGAGMFQRVLNSVWKVTTSNNHGQDRNNDAHGGVAMNSAGGTAAGSPSHGSYFRNPTWKIRVRRPNTVVMARLRIVTSPSTSTSTASSTVAAGAGYPYINLALFRLLVPSTNSDTTSLSRESLSNSRGKQVQEVASSGSYSDLAAGVLLPKVRLEQDTTYVLIPSTYSPNVESKFEILLWFNQADSLDISSPP